MAEFLRHAIGNVSFHLPRPSIARLKHRVAELGIIHTIQRGLTLHFRIVLNLASCSLVGALCHHPDLCGRRRHTPDSQQELRFFLEEDRHPRVDSRLKPPSIKA